MKCKSPEARARKVAAWRAARARAHAGEGFIYVAAIGEAVVKIGYSLDPTKRSRTIYRRGRKEPIRLLMAVPGTWAEEKRLHRTLRDECLGSEIYPRSILSHPAIPAELRAAA